MTHMACRLDVLDVNGWSIRMGYARITRRNDGKGSRRQLFSPKTEKAVMQKQQDRVNIAVAQIVADGGQNPEGRDGNAEGNASHDSK